VWQELEESLVRPGSTTGMSRALDDSMHRDKANVKSVSLSQEDDQRVQKTLLPQQAKGVHRRELRMGWFDRGEHKAKASIGQLSS